MVLQVLCGLVVIAVVLIQTGKSEGLSGAIGGGGLGDLAIRYGYQRFRLGIMVAAVVIILILVEIVQFLGTKLANKLMSKR